MPTLSGIVAATLIKRVEIALEQSMDFISTHRWGLDQLYLANRVNFIAHPEPFIAPKAFEDGLLRLREVRSVRVASESFSKIYIGKCMDDSKMLNQALRGLMCRPRPGTTSAGETDFAELKRCKLTFAKRLLELLNWEGKHDRNWNWQATALEVRTTAIMIRKSSQHECVPEIPTCTNS